MSRLILEEISECVKTPIGAIVLDMARSDQVFHIVIVHFLSHLSGLGVGDFTTTAYLNWLEPGNTLN